MDDYWSTYRQDASTARWRTWVGFAVVLSLATHLALFFAYKRWDLSILLPTPDLEPSPRLERVTISPTLLTSTQQEALIPESPDELAPPVVTAYAPADEVSLQDALPDDRAVTFTPGVSEPTNLATVAPAVTPSLMDSLELPGLETGITDPAALPESASILSRPVSDDQLRLDSSFLDAPSLEGVGNSPLDSLPRGEAAELPGFASLDGILGGGGAVTSGDDPILMPSDLLFDYDSADLAPNARGSLMKLALIIQSNPDSTFIIEGHTDTIGTVEYNQLLSLRRAEAVKSWLVRSLQLDPARIETVGIGKARPLQNPGGTPEEQAINRRVEITVKPE
jgi:outer membrane protein OmpA-like peptidoglycan-associated protein